MDAYTVRSAEELYQVQGWGDGHFAISPQGTLQVRPEGPTGAAVDLQAAVERLAEQGIRPPVVLRFPQLLRHRVERLNHAFRRALKDNGCKDVRYRGVFPIKVNQRREVVQALSKAGRPWQFGLEVGSKAELVAALTMDPSRKSLLIVNGFKDKAFLEAACDATAFKDEVIIVLDEVGELPALLPMLDKASDPPTLGLRLKLRSKAPGKWALSGGGKAKFGLTIPEVLWAVEELRKAGHLDRLQMLHFHIGSQISQIRRIAEATREAARMHAELVRLGVPLRLLDLGGGLAIDYDGSASSAPTSCNYTVEEYASTVVAILKDACDDAEVPMPDIISESGRFVVTHHAVFITNVLRRIPYLAPDPDTGGPQDADPTPLWNLYEMHEDLSAKNAFESFHDAVQIRDDLYQLFDLGHLRLEQLGRAERLLRSTFRRVRTLLEKEEETETEEYEQARALMGQKLVCNFSLFQSLPDIWGVKQRFPILPLHRLGERPTEVATLADITCDSDGEIRHFTGPNGTRGELPVHPMRPGEPYHFAMALVGAYQDTLGDYHNLFGETDEAFLETTEEGGWRTVLHQPGSRVADMLEWVRYDPADLKRRLGRRIDTLHRNGRISKDEATSLRRRFTDLIGSSTYLEAAP